MAYRLNYNHGSFNFEEFKNFLISLLITTLYSEHKLSAKAICDIINGNKTISNTAIEEALKPFINDLSILEYIKERKIVKVYLASNLNMDANEFLTASLSLALKRFSNTTTFPDTVCEFTEIFRLMVDLSLNSESMAYTSPSIKYLLKEHKKTWDQQRKAWCKLNGETFVEVEDFEVIMEPALKKVAPPVERFEVTMEPVLKKIAAPVEIAKEKPPEKPEPKQISWQFTQDPYSYLDRWHYLGPTVTITPAMVLALSQKDAAEAASKEIKNTVSTQKLSCDS